MPPREVEGHRVGFVKGAHVQVSGCGARQRLHTRDQQAKIRGAVEPARERQRTQPIRPAIEDQYEGAFGRQRSADALSQRGRIALI